MNKLWHYQWKIYNQHVPLMVTGTKYDILAYVWVLVSWMKLNDTLICEEYLEGRGVSLTCVGVCSFSHAPLAFNEKTELKQNTVQPPHDGKSDKMGLEDSQVALESTTWLKVTPTWAPTFGSFLPLAHTHTHLTIRTKKERKNKRVHHLRLFGHWICSRIVSHS